MSKKLIIFAWISFFAIAIFVINEVENMKAEKSSRQFLRTLFEINISNSLNE